MIKGIIVDDDENIRNLLVHAINKINTIEIMGVFKNGKEAVEFVEKNKVDCVFIDVEMPVLDGISASKQMIDISPKISIIFITAFQDYMPEAFSLYAFDYMIKPFKMDRLKETIKRLEMVKKDLQDDKEMINTEIKTGYIDNNEKIALKIKTGTEIFFLNDIFIIERENKDTIIITDKGKFEIHENLTDIEEKLPKDMFMRSHRSYIINMNKIERFIKYGRWTYIVKFLNHEEDALITLQNLKKIEENLSFKLNGNSKK